MKLAVIGCGYWGPNLVRNFRSLPDCELNMLCDISDARIKHLRALYPEVKGEKDYDHMLNGAGLDAVVSTRPRSGLLAGLPYGATVQPFGPVSRMWRPWGLPQKWIGGSVQSSSRL